MLVVHRRELPTDGAAIFDLTQRAFAGKPYSAGTEPLIVDALRLAGALTLSLVAVLDGELCGHVAFSPVTISDGSDGWYGMGPVSVAPESQRQGIGSGLIREGLHQLQAVGAKGCVVLGDPRYYERFGFRTTPDLVYKGAPPEYFMAQPFGESTAQGVVDFHPAFSVALPPREPS